MNSSMNQSYINWGAVLAIILLQTSRIFVYVYVFDNKHVIVWVKGQG